MQPKVYPLRQQFIDPKLMDHDALYVISKLHRAGFTAYLVGGSVRDLLLGHTPKDFDISTSAKPEEIRRLFTNSILIGRRFRLAHIRFGRKIIEVATFRAGDPEDSEFITRDNTWGTPEEDVLRRDFTINGLFFDPQENCVIDYVGGMEDLEKHLLRSIGDPLIRFKQDPVRMIRLLKFVARFNFNVEDSTWQALTSCQKDIQKSSPARVLEELMKMLESGYSYPFFKLLNDSGILKLLFPKLEAHLKNKDDTFMYQLLQAADQFSLEEDTPPFHRSLHACCLLYPLLKDAIDCFITSKGVNPHYGDVVHMTHELIIDVISSAFSSFPKRMRSTMEFILNAQFRLTPFENKKGHFLRILKHPEFTLALDFLQIRAHVDPSIMPLYTSWHTHHHKRKHIKTDLE